VRGPIFGLALSEAIVSVFLLAAGFVVTSRLFHQALQYETQISSQQTAVQLAERQMELIRGWSRDFHRQPGNSFASWGACPGIGGPTPVATHPNYSITVTTLAHQLDSPCSLFESLKAGADRRSMVSSCRDVLVQVDWGARSYVLRSLVAAPAILSSSVLTIGCTPSGVSNVAQNGTLTIVSQVRDSSSMPIPDVVLTHFVLGDGNGTIVQTPLGGQSTLTNAILDASDPPNVVGFGVGLCNVVVTGRCRGRLMRGQTGQINVQ
jgi:hypothetical protein